MTDGSGWDGEDHPDQANGRVQSSRDVPATDFTFTGQRADGSTQLIQMGARWVEPRIGRWVSADSIVPDPGSSQCLNRHAYVDGNPLVYTDPTGHFVWVPVAIGAAVGFIVGTVSYAAATPADQRNWGDWAIVAGTCTAGGALVGTGIGASEGLAMIAGVGMGGATSGVGYVISNGFTGEPFDRTDFFIQTGFGAVEGGIAGVSAAHPQMRPLEPIAASTVLGAAASATSDRAHDRPFDAYGTLSGAGQGLLGGVIGEAFTGGFRGVNPDVIGPGTQPLDLQSQAMPQWSNDAAVRAYRWNLGRQAVRTALRDSTFYTGEYLFWHLSAGLPTGEESAVGCPIPGGPCP